MNVGDRITSLTTYHDLPVGSQIRGTHEWVKTGDNEWSRPSTSTRGGTLTRRSEQLSTGGEVSIVAVGLGATPPPGPGESLRSIAQWAALPVGSIVARAGRDDDDRYHYRRISEPTGLMWENVNTGQQYEDRQIAGQIAGQYTVVTIIKENAMPTYETPDKFMWLFYGVVAKAAAEHGVPQSTVTDAIKAIGHPVPGPMPGADIRWSEQRDKLPAGTIVYCGYPESPVRFGVFKKGDRGSWTHIMGPSKRMDNVIHVDYLPGVEGQSWALEPGSAETAKEAAKLRAKAWQVGIKVKHAHGWCGELEGILHLAGLSEKSIEAARDFDLAIGSAVSVEQAATLPTGSIFRWENGSDYCYYKRVDDGRVRNISRTRRIFGYRADGGPLRHYHNEMTVLHFGDENMNLRLTITREQFVMLPPGTAWHFNGEQLTAPAYIMARDGRCAAYSNTVPDYGTWDLRDLIGSANSGIFTFTNLEAQP